MTYEDGNGFNNFNVKYGYPTIANTNKLKRLYKTGEPQYPNINSPLKFVEHMITNGKFSGFNKNTYTGVVVVGYENNIPKLYTFRMGENDKDYSINNKKRKDMYYNHSEDTGCDKKEVITFKTHILDWI